MTLIGRRLRAHRRKQRLTQKELAKSTTGSFISRIERGHDLPSLQVLHQLAEQLGLTAGELMGDYLLLEAAKLTVLKPEYCRKYLEELPSTSITKYLASLTTCVENHRLPIPEPPPNGEMYFLAAQLSAYRNNFTRAIEYIHKGLNLTRSQPYTELRLKALLINLQEESSPANLHPHIWETRLRTKLPSPEMITFEDVALATIVQFLILIGMDSDLISI